MKTINLLELLEEIASRWYLLVICMILGGLIGLGISTILPPFYESEAAFSVTIDYTQTGALTDVEEDQAMRGVGSVIFSDDVIIPLIQNLASDGISINDQLFNDNATMDREEFRWTIWYRDTSPQVAYLVADAWAKQADQILQQALLHARLADSYQDLLSSLETCLQNTTQTNSGLDSCSLENMDLITAEIEKTSDLVSSELQESQGLFSALSVELVDTAQQPSQPVRRQRNTLVFSAAALGFFTGIFLLTLFSQFRRKAVNV